MKRIVSLLLCILILSAATPGLALASGQASIDVYAKYKYDTGLWEAPVEDGKGGGTLPDGTEIEVTDAPEDVVWLVVRKIGQNETEVYSWFKQVLSGKGSILQAYEIYFMDKHYNRIPASGAKITLTAPKDMDDTKMFSVTPAGSYRELTLTLANANGSFTTDGSRYYVFAGYGFEDYRDKILEDIDDKHEDKEDDVRKDRIDEAYKDVEDYEYDPDKSYEENKEELDKILEELEKDLKDLEEFEEYRDIVLDKTDDLHKDGEDDKRKELIDKIYDEIKDYEYDFDKTLQENKDAIYRKLDELCKKLGVNTPYVPKTGDSSNILLWACTAGMSALLLCALLLLLFKRRKEERKE